LGRFFPKKRGFRNGCKCLSIKGKAGRDRDLKNVLTIKRGLSLGVLAGKQGVGADRKPFYFALLHVFVVFCIGKSLSARIFGNMGVSQKNRAEKPTVGFLFLGSRGMIQP
jgi:hypothetical protein